MIMDDPKLKSEISRGFLVCITLLNTLRFPFLLLRKIFYRPMRWGAKRFGFDYVFIPRSFKDAARTTDIQLYLAQLFDNAVEIQIAVGEMGHRLMERPEIINGLRNAAIKNKATIEIVHGPRVDPATLEVFSLAQQDLLTLYRMPEYARHHFILVRSKSGTETLIDEGFHNETLWPKDKSGRAHEVSASSGRSYYITTQAKRVIESRRIEVERRKLGSQLIKDHPGLEPPQKYSLVGYVLDGLINTPLRALVQPFSIAINTPIDIQARPWYKRNISMHERPFQFEPDIEAEMEMEAQLAQMELPDEIRFWLEPRLASSGLYSKGLTGYSILLFRELHAFENPTTSVGMLPIDNEAFVELAVRGLWTTNQLEDGFKKNPNFLGTYRQPGARVLDWRDRVKVALP